MRFMLRVARHAVVLAAMALTSCTLENGTGDSGPVAAIKVVNLLQGVDNASIGFETGRPLSVIAFPSIAPVDAAAYYFVAAGVPRQLRVLRTTSTVLDSTVTFTANLYYTIVLTGSTTGTGIRAPGYLVLQNNMGAVTTGSVRFRFVHGATGTASVDVHVAADSVAFDATTSLMQDIPFRGTATSEARLAGNQKVCVIATGVKPTATGSNCAAVRAFGVSSGIGMTAALRDPSATETVPGLLLTLDRTP